MDVTKGFKNEIELKGTLEIIKCLIEAIEKKRERGQNVIRSADDGRYAETGQARI